MRPLITVRRRASLLTARDLLATHDLEELPVVEGGRVVGVVCEGDIYGIVSAHRDDDGWMQELLVEDIMKAPPLVRGPDERAGGGAAAAAGRARPAACWWNRTDASSAW